MIETMLHPTALARKDSIGLVAPAGQLPNISRFETGIRILSEMGFEPRFPRTMWPGYGYLADSDTNRLAELHKNFADQEIKGLIAARGGYGCLRLAGDVDMQLIRRERKMMVGFSDISLLLNQVVHQAGLLCLHGPVITSLCDCTPPALERFYHCITGNWGKGITPKNLEIIRGEGEAKGMLVGGNLSTLMTVLATPFDFSWEDKIVLLEDVSEPLYRLDRMLTQLSLAGKFDKVKGIILGDFNFGQNLDFLEKMRNLEYIWTRIKELTRTSQATVWANFPSGHCPDNLTLPLGATAIMDCGSGELRFE